MNSGGDVMGEPDVDELEAARVAAEVITVMRFSTPLKFEPGGTRPRAQDSMIPDSSLQTKRQTSALSVLSHRYA